MTVGIKKRYRCTIIGAGPAGLAAAACLYNNGIKDFLLVERDEETGGILNQCIHNGFGLKFFKEDLTGPEFARKIEKQLPDSANILKGAMVSSVEHPSDGKLLVKIRSRVLGLLCIETDSVITATGCRERTRENLEVPGSRPAGIFTAGQAQNLLNRRHYSIGKKILIQGSGDIGLIMARRLTLEGFDVAAVLERLPYLSGSIRNKVQCLDHFGIPLLLGRQITDIRGKDRVNSVASTALDADLNPVHGTEKIFNCDTVLFAAGLIPELETIKTAGVNIPDRFHPEVNALFETNVPGIFSAGNCLHINDLADSAAAEGHAAAEAVIDFLNKPDVFRQKASSQELAGRLPYRKIIPDRNLDDQYFQRIIQENLKVCIVCPKGCLLSDGNYGCCRGEEYWKRTFGESSSANYMQRAHTTVEIINRNSGKKMIIPVVSEANIHVSLIKEAVSAVKKKAAELTGNESEIEVPAGGENFIFKPCRKQYS